MRGGGGDGVKDLAAGGWAAYVVIPDSFAELTTANRADRAATGFDAAARSCSGLESCAPLLGPPGATVRGLAFLSSRAGKIARVVSRRFCDSGSLDRVVGLAFF
jgi:hypothetical protein